MGMVAEFKKFISRGNVVDLAVGIIIGAAFTGIVNSLVNDVIMPPLGYVLGGLDFSNYYLSLDGTAYPTLKAAQEAGAPTLNYGLFLNAVLKFLIVSFAIFLLVKQLNRFWRREAEKAPLPAQEVLLAEIRDILKAKG